MRTDVSVRTGVPILDGININFPLIVENPLRAPVQFHPMDANGIVEPKVIEHTSATALMWNSNQSQDAQYFNQGAAPQEVFSVSSILGADDYSPLFQNFSNCFNIYELTLKVKNDSTEKPATGTVTFKVGMRHERAGTRQEHAERVFYHSSDNLYSEWHEYKMQFLAYNQINYVIIDAGGSGYNTSSAIVTLTQYSREVSTCNSQCSVISVQGVPDAVSYSLQGLQNWEYAPGPALRPDTQPTTDVTSNVADFTVAAHALQGIIEHLSIDNVSTMSEYSIFQSALDKPMFERSYHYELAFLGFLP